MQKYTIGNVWTTGLFIKATFSQISAISWRSAQRDKLSVWLHSSVPFCVKVYHVPQGDKLSVWIHSIVPFCLKVYHVPQGDKLPVWIHSIVPFCLKLYHVPQGDKFSVWIHSIVLFCLKLYHVSQRDKLCDPVCSWARSRPPSSITNSEIMCAPCLLKSKYDNYYHLLSSQYAFGGKPLLQYQTKILWRYS
jgi:hypothetical protein